MQRLTPEAPEAAEGALEPMAEVVEKTAGGEAVTTSPEIALEVAGDPRRRAHPVCTNDGGHLE
jgi:hypothetical protein